MSKMIILAGPSGAGKSSLVERVIKEFSQVEDTVTFTTRSMRKGESEGVPYHFIDRSKFESLIKDDFFVEWAEVHGNLYGTPHHQIKDIWAKGRAVIMDVDVQGARTFKTRFPQALTIFIQPPSIEELRRRIVTRDKNPKDLEVRMENAQREMAQADWFDKQVLNDDFHQSFTKLKKIIDEFLKIP